ncbi:MAG: ABC transporter permease [Spirochaetaceae bacterium]|nr:MAG: ABC transporter permease [Spirochaetaceae bacterium]
MSRLINSPESDDTTRELLRSQRATEAGDRMKSIVLPTLSFVGFILIWHFAVVYFDLPVYILPRPLSIFPEIARRPEMFLRHAWVTLFETLAGLGLSIATGVILAFMIVWSDNMEKMLMPFIVLSQTFPKTAIAPLMIIWFGYGYLPKIIISFLIAFFPIVINTVLGLKSPKSDMIDLMRSMSATKAQVFAKVRIPMAVPYFFSGLKIGITLALVGAVVGEFVGADSGLGFLIMAANNQFNTRLAFATLFVLMILGAFLYFIAEFLERRVAPWFEASRRTDK